ncbi:hypothetical protein [Endothiovibrio diazotrophicus]
MERCPACRARLGDPSRCPRCGCNLERPQQAERAARRAIAAALTALARKRLDEALHHARHARRLKDGDAARLLEWFARKSTETDPGSGTGGEIRNALLGTVGNE